MKKMLISALFACGLVAAVEAAPADTVTQADLQALIERIAKLEAENKAQAAKIAELEKARPVAVAAKGESGGAAPAHDEGTEVSESGRVYTTEQGYKYYLADRFAGIFEPLSESGFKITPYGYLIFEGVHNTHKTSSDYITDWVMPRRNGRHNGDHQTCLTMQDSELGFRFETPEMVDGWRFSGKAEFDFVGNHANDYAFHWRHLYVDARHDGFDSDGKKNGEWSILFGQTWHLWKMVTPNEIDGAWMENCGHPYRRSPQFRVTRTWDFEDSSLEARVGVVKNGPGMGGDRDGDGNQDNSASAWGLVEAAVLYTRDAAWQREWLADDPDGLCGRRWTFGVGGMYGRDKFHRLSENGAYDGTSDEYDSDLVMFAAQLPIWRFTLTGQIFAGENLGGVQAGVGQTIGYTGVDRKGKEVRTVGGFIDLTYRFNRKWDFTLGYGFDNPNDNDAAGAADRIFNDRAYVGAAYRITSNFKIAVEYAHLKTKYYAQGDAGDDRFQFAAFYNF